jgi:hypothetical protein
MPFAKLVRLIVVETNGRVVEGLQIEEKLLKMVIINPVANFAEVIIRIVVRSVATKANFAEVIIRVIVRSVTTKEREIVHG